MLSKSADEIKKQILLMTLKQMKLNIDEATIDEAKTDESVKLSRQTARVVERVANGIRLWRE